MAKTPGVPISLTETESAREGLRAEAGGQREPRRASACRRALPSGPRHRFKRRHRLPGLSPTAFPREAGSLGLTPLTGGLRGPPSPARTNQHSPGAAPRAATLPSGGDWPARPSLKRSRPAHASLPCTPPSQSGKNGRWARVAANGRRGAPG